MPGGQGPDAADSRPGVTSSSKLTTEYQHPQGHLGMVRRREPAGVLGHPAVGRCWHRAAQGRMEVMKPEVPVELQRLINDELHSDSGLGGRRLWWDRPAVLAVDMAGDIAAALLWQGGGVVASALFERGGTRWRSAGGGAGGRPSAGTAGPAHVLTVCESFCARRRRVPGTAGSGWVAAHHLRLAREVSYLDVGGRRAAVPAHGRVVVVWEASRSPLFLAETQPHIAACRGDGAVLSELGPGDVIDSATLRGSVKDLP